MLDKSYPSSMYQWFLLLEVVMHGEQNFLSLWLFIVGKNLLDSVNHLTMNMASIMSFSMLI